jgi:hypothetical protein
MYGLNLSARERFEGYIAEKQPTSSAIMYRYGDNVYPVEIFELMYVDQRANELIGIATSGTTQNMATSNKTRLGLFDVSLSLDNAHTRCLQQQSATPVIATG